jgi:hypothetical protein
MSAEATQTTMDTYKPAPIPPNRADLEPIPLPPCHSVSSGEGDAKSYDAYAANLEPGYEKYCAIRRAWVSQGRPVQRPQRPVDVEAICECLANNRSTTFKHPIPLAEMVNTLVELWEDDGLYD